MPATTSPTYSTTGTVSSPLNLDSLVVPKGEHETVRLNGSSSKKIRPKPKVTLTSLTVNNVSPGRTSTHISGLGPPFSGWSCADLDTLDWKAGVDGRSLGRCARSIAWSYLSSTRTNSTRTFWIPSWMRSTSSVWSNSIYLLAFGFWVWTD